MPEFQFNGLADFFQMGGDALFVWASYGAFAVVVLWFLIQPKMHKRTIVKLIRARVQREAAQQQRVNQAEQG